MTKTASVTEMIGSFITMHGSIIKINCSGRVAVMFAPNVIAFAFVAITFVPVAVIFVFVAIIFVDVAINFRHVAITIVMKVIAWDIKKTA